MIWRSRKNVPPLYVEGILTVHRLWQHFFMDHLIHEKTISYIVFTGNNELKFPFIKGSASCILYKQYTKSTFFLSKTLAKCPAPSLHSTGTVVEYACRKRKLSQGGVNYGKFLYLLSYFNRRIFHLWQNRG